MKQPLLFLATLCTLTFIQGCGGVGVIAQKSIFSAPQIAEMGGELDNTTIRIEMPGLNLSVTSVYRPIIKEVFIVLIIPLWWETAPKNIPPETWIELWLDPEGEEFSFNPMHVTLQTANGKSIKPKGFFGPIRHRFFLGLDFTCLIRTNYQHNCPAALGDGTIKSTDGPISHYQRPASFYLVFDKPPYPNMRFTLLIEGIEKAGRPFPIPIIHFKEGSSWNFR